MLGLSAGLEGSANPMSETVRKRAYITRKNPNVAQPWCTGISKGAPFSSSAKQYFRVTVQENGFVGN